MPLDPIAVAKATRCPSQAVVAYWPLLVSELLKAQIRTDMVEVALAATIAIETAWTFRPINERGSDEYFTRYDYRTMLGNTEPGDGKLYRGRGFIQLTGRANYKAAGERLGLDLVADPDLALEPLVSAGIAVWYFKTRRVAAAANVMDWRDVRRLVNGGFNGWDQFYACVVRLLEGLANGVDR